MPKKHILDWISNYHPVVQYTAPQLICHANSLEPVLGSSSKYAEVNGERGERKWFDYYKDSSLFYRDLIKEINPSNRFKKALLWTIYLLSQHPKLAVKVIIPINKLFGSASRKQKESTVCLKDQIFLTVLGRFCV